MTFVATGDSTAPAEAVLVNDGFFPDIDPEDLRKSQRLDGTVTYERLLHALIEAIASVNSELAAFKAAQLLAGHATLAAVPAETINDTSINVHRYNRAVFSMAKADLSERYRDYDSTNAGNIKADQMETPIDDIRRDARWAISDILGVGRNTVELI